MQSWGTSSRFEVRETNLEPSKSGVLGILCAALGRDRSEDISDLAALKMGVRVDKEGILKRDYHTAQEIVQADGKLNSNRDMRNIVSERYYLADAAFLVGLEPPTSDVALLTRIQEALRNPRWPLSLGRKSFVPSPGVYLPDGLRDENLLDALESYPPAHTTTTKQKSLRFIIEDSNGNQIRSDQPLGPFAERQFIGRRVRTESRANPFLEAGTT